MEQASESLRGTLGAGFNGREWIYEGRNRLKTLMPPSLQRVLVDYNAEERELGNTVKSAQKMYNAGKYEEAIKFCKEVSWYRETV